MSGGAFDGNQHRLTDMIDIINLAIERNKEGLDLGYGEKYYTNYSEKTLERFKMAAFALEHTRDMVDAIDRLISADTNEESFDEEWTVLMEKKK